MIEVRAPMPGWFRLRVEAGQLVAPGDVIGELDVLGRIVKVTAPRVGGVVKLVDPSPRRAVGYGDVLVVVDADGVDAAPVELAPVADGLVFLAPTSGRYYGRPAPDKPAFVTANDELNAGTTICLLEVMKTFHRVTYGGAPARVRAVLVADGADVNAGDALLALDPV